MQNLHASKNIFRRFSEKTAALKVSGKTKINVFSRVPFK